MPRGCTCFHHARRARAEGESARACRKTPAGGPDHRGPARGGSVGRTASVGGSRTGLDAASGAACCIARVSSRRTRADGRPTRRSVGRSPAGSVQGASGDLEIAPRSWNRSSIAVPGRQTWHRIRHISRRCDSESSFDAESELCSLGSHEVGPRSEHASLWNRALGAARDHSLGSARLINSVCCWSRVLTPRSTQLPDVASEGLRAELEASAIVRYDDQVSAKRDESRLNNRSKGPQKAVARCANLGAAADRLPGLEEARGLPG